MSFSYSGKLFREAGTGRGTLDLSYFGAWIGEILANAGHHIHVTRLVPLLEVDRWDGRQNPGGL